MLIGCTLDWITQLVCILSFPLSCYAFSYEYLWLSYMHQLQGIYEKWCDPLKGILVCFRVRNWQIPLCVFLPEAAEFRMFFLCDTIHSSCLFSQCVENQDPQPLPIDRFIAVNAAPFGGNCSSSPLSGEQFDCDPYSFMDVVDRQWWVSWMEFLAINYDKKHLKLSERYP